MVYLLLAYIIYLILFAIFSVIGVYHLWRFGYVGDLTKPAIITYVILVSLVIIVSIILILTHSWPMSLNNNNPV